jgi:valyl-tRNA synthetase
MMDKFGTDAFRFTLAAFTAQGRDVRMSEERIEGNKFFVNKIWNATRFSMMNLEDYDAAVPICAADESIADCWIRARLNRTIAEVVRGLDEYRFNDAAGAVYQFVWHEFCDWYLELAKPLLYGVENPAGRRAAQKTLLEVLTASLKLLHPFMPFLTEEIWQTLVADGTSVMVGEFPAADDASSDPQAEQEMAQIMEVITRIRNIRGEMNVAPSLKLKVTLTAPSEELMNSLERGRIYIRNLANLERLEIVGEMAEPKGAATAVAGPVHVYVFLAGVIDVEGEKGRLGKEIAKVEKELATSAKKLANPEFLAKAAEEVVKKEREKARVIGEKKAALDAALQRIASIDTDR